MSYVDYILRGISEGFRIGFDYSCHTCSSLHGNMLTNFRESRCYGQLLAKELSEGNIVKVTDPSGLLGLQVSPFGVIPKRHTPNRWRLIADLSNPKGNSVSDGINKELCSLSYVSVDTIAKQITSARQGHFDGKNGCAECLQIDSNSPVRSSLARHVLEESPFCGQSIASWTLICPKNL